MTEHELVIIQSYFLVYRCNAQKHDKSYLNLLQTVRILSVKCLRKRRDLKIRLDNKLSVLSYF